MKAVSLVASYSMNKLIAFNNQLLLFDKSYALRLMRGENN